MWQHSAHKLNYRIITTALIHEYMKKKLEHIAVSYSENAMVQVKEPGTRVIA